MTKAYLVLNAGSSSLKFSIFDQNSKTSDPVRLYRGDITGIGGAPRFSVRDPDNGEIRHTTLPPDTGQAGALEHLLVWLKNLEDAIELVAAGHRIVHGGRVFPGPVRVTDAVISELETLSSLAPLHQPHNLAGIRAVQSAYPDLPQIACFDTSFHMTQPDLARRFALPEEITDKGVERYGFHGLSYEYVRDSLRRKAPSVAEGRVIAAHLGHGASLCALRGGNSIATTMGFTALDGLPMGTRCGDLDPGVVLHLLGPAGYSLEEVTALLYRQSGLLGLSGISDDMRDLLASDAPRAKLAVDLFVYRTLREIGSLTAALQGLDALVFTAGIGENAPLVREKIGAALGWLGLEVEPARNHANAKVISTDGSRVSCFVIPTDEESIVARHIHESLAT